MNPPRLHSKLRLSAAKCDEIGGSGCFEPHTANAEMRAVSAPSADHRTFTAHSEAGFPHTGLSVSELTRIAQLDQLEAEIDGRMQTVLLNLATCSQVRGAAPEARAADSNALHLPVNAQGKALGEDPVGDLGREYAHANRIKGREKRIQIKHSLLERARRELKSTRYSRRKQEDLGTQEGRLNLARFARKMGSRKAAEAYCLDPTDPKSVKSMMRNIQRYLLELNKIEGMR